jgi:uncharacterized protein (DUF169 family)
MHSILSDELKLRLMPVAVLFTDDKPAEALQFQEGQRGCVVSLLHAAAKGGKTAVFDRETTPCRGGTIGLELAEAWADPEGMAYFLSVGGGPSGREGEGYLKTPELAHEFMAHLGAVQEPHRYRVLKPLSDVDPEAETPRLVVFLGNPDQLSALTVLANYERGTGDAVVVRFGAGCHSFCLQPDRLNQAEPLRAVLGMMDISARPMVPADVLSFTIPWPMFLEMEGNVRGSFFDRKDWHKVRARLAG